MGTVWARGRTWVKAVPSLVWLLMTCSFLNITGLSLLWPVNAIYIHEVLGQPMTIAGTVLLVYSAAGLAGSFLAGAGYDRFGALPVLTAGFAVCAASILVPLRIGGWVPYMGVMAVFGLACAVPFPVFNALVGHAWPDGGRRAYNFMYVANNIGVAAGTALGGVMAQRSFASVFWGIALVNAILLILLWTVLRTALRQLRSGRAQQARRTQEAPDRASAPDRRAAAPSAAAPGTVASGGVPWRPVTLVLVGFTAGWAIYVQWQTAISVYMQDLGYPLAAYSALWTLNGVLIFVLQPAVAAVVRRVPYLAWHMAMGMVLYAAAYALVALWHTYPAFVAAMTVMTLGEVLAWPSVPAAIGQLAPLHRLGYLQGLVGSTATLGRMVGPIAGGWLFDHAGVQALLWSASAACVLPALCFTGFHAAQRRNAPETGRSSAF
ncbi:MFS transporter [Alicyclobacillus macrosporangiidus]|uniref:Predicted arabinose efflux permease, MFS family n=1 Tax=Alicyclobacillus macrosporangiidus TaxID=392015 RepID=A0A1I7GX04_9BACL|nr:MFS transporter [Alicyclobacillus macrosporangiidus]SFU52949.1 Predicted arabinose efflux permease, MFS family [Alicyclobacillus macrosporangiidus]